MKTRNLLLLLLCTPFVVMHGEGDLSKTVPHRNFNTLAPQVQPLQGGEYVASRLIAQAISSLMTQNQTSQEVSYKLPVALANVGTIKVEDNAVCSYLFPNTTRNQGAYLLASGNKPVHFVGQADQDVTAWQWHAAGTKEQVATTQEASFHYTQEGVFGFPSLIATTAKGQVNYTPPLKIKSGGSSEVTTINTLKYNTTYQFGTFVYNQDAGYVGGTNKLGIAGWGNLFMFGTDDAHMEGINLYLHHKPKHYAKDAKLLVRVWFPTITDRDIVFCSIPIEAVYAKVSEAKGGNDDVWVPTDESAVMEIKFENPIDLYGKTMLFISVEGFGTDPSANDICLLMDVKGTPLDELSMSNRLAHNSFGRLEAEKDFLRPISYYGGGTGSFAICPVIRTKIASTSREVSALEPSFSVRLQGEVLQINSVKSGTTRIYDISGHLLASRHIDQGTSLWSVELEQGFYLVVGPNGQVVRISK